MYKLEYVSEILQVNASIFVTDIQFKFNVYILVVFYIIIT